MAECIYTPMHINPDGPLPERIIIYGVSDVWLAQAAFDAFDPMNGVYAKTQQTQEDVPVVATPESVTARKKVYQYIATNDLGTATAVRNVYLWGNPTIVSPDITIYQGDDFDPYEGVTATDFDGKDISKAVRESGYYNTEVPGTYTLTYTVDSNGFIGTSTRRLTVLPWEPPTLNLPPEPVIMEGDPFDPMEGVSAEDYEGTDLTADVVISGTVDNSKAGEYTLTYSVTDRLGRTTRKQQIVTVTPNIYATYLFADGHLMINGLKEDLTDYIAEHGSLVREYKAGPYNFTWETDPPWYRDRTRVTSAEVKTPYKPRSTAYLFSNLLNCTSIDVSNIDTSACTNFDYMFMQCNKVKYIDVTGFDTSHATTMKGMFLGCWVLNWLDLRNWDTSNVMNFHAMFYNNNDLVTIYAKPSFVVPTGADTIHMFAMCGDLAGGMGTQWNSSYTDGERALIDEGLTKPGYFTDATKKVTTLYKDGTLVINETYDQRLQNIERHGQVYHQYSATTAENNWAAEWNNNADVKHVFFGTPVTPGNMDLWFQGCTNMTGIELTGLDMSQCTSMRATFDDCHSIEEIDWTYLDTSNVTNMAGLFRNCNIDADDLEDIFQWNTSNVTNMAGIFMGIKGLSVIAPTFDTSKVDYAPSMFAYMDVPVIDLRGMDISAIRDGAVMFGINPDLKTIYANAGQEIDPACNSTNMFMGSLNVVGGKGTTVTLINGEYARVDEGTTRPGYFTLKRKDLMTTFYADQTLIINEREQDREANIAIHGQVREEFDPGPYACGQGWNQPWMSRPIQKVVFGSPLKQDSMAWFFTSMGNLREIDFTNLDTSECTSYSHMCRMCHNLRTANVELLDLSHATTTDYMFYEVWYIQHYNTGNWDTSNVTDMSGMFYECDYVKQIDLEDWDVSKVTSFRYMFANDKLLDMLDTSKWDTSSCRSFGGMFYYCEELDNIDCSNFDTSSAVDMAQMFCGCKHATYINVDGFDTSTVTTMEEMFDECQTVTELKLTSFTAESCEKFRYMFRNCRELVTIFATADFNLSSTKDGTYMFQYDTKLKGDQGTVYNASRTGIERARLDGGSYNPGYFSVY